MYISKLRVAVVVIILSAIICAGSAVALLSEYYIIPSSGSISPVPPVTPGRGVAYNSEIRALFVHAFSFINADWATILQTAKNYGINTMVFEMLGNNYARYPSAYIPYGDYGFSTIITEAHNRGMEVHVSMDVLLSSLGPEYQCETSAGTKIDWTCPTKQVTRTLIRNLVEELARNYDIDGFMFDYVRYDTTDTCYCSECKAAFEQYLGETITVWPGDFAPGRSRYNEFMEWRSHPINDLVRDMRNWLLAVKPNLEISAAVWGWEPGYPTYNRYWIGQDSAYWVKEGWLDWVAPMMYTTDLARLQAFIQDYHQHMTAGPEGKIPLVAFLSNCFPAVVDPTTFKACIDTVRASGADGWIIWRYGGPGDGQGSGAPDIRQYLNIIDRPSIFSLKDITVSPDSQSVTITWTTDLPATSKVEYSTSLLFTASFIYDYGVDFSYWDIDHVAGTVVEKTTPATTHSITLTNLQEGTLYYYRVQSQDISGIATSKVYTFKL